ncbi:MAG TPA: DUF481 domain-containing protein, partial [candidate division Zixibacteria bacterium]|nr:DUF481 domain-containing protein [candidate division Zixibacteria bacterium]
YVSLNGSRGVTKVSSVTYLQPRVTDFADLRTISQSSLMVAVNSNVSLAFNFDLAYDSRPAPGVEKLDTETSIGVKLVW